MSYIWVEPFLISLARQGVITQAARDAGVTRQYVYELRDSDGTFARRWDDALEQHYDKLEAELLHRATHGHEEPLTYQGQFTYVRDFDAIDPETGNPYLAMQAPVKRDPDGNPVIATIKKKADTLLMFALKGRRKRTYADRTELTGADGAPVEIDATTRRARLAAILAKAQQRKDFSDIA